MIKSFYLTFLGCKVNSYENNALSECLIQNGYFYDEINPGVVIINTCSVTSIADKKSRHEIRFYKKKYPNAIIIAIGCAIQSMDAKILDELEFDVAVGTNNKLNIIKYIEEFDKNHKKIIDVDKNFRSFEYEEIDFINQYDQVRAYVKIQDGCDKFCSYCLIPFVRGRNRSRNKENILKEIGNLLDSGYNEIVLTGIDVASYGLDFDYKYTFSDLLEEILLKYPNLYRIRISSIEESMVDDKFLYLLEKYPNIADHLHLSLQSGCNKTLQRMNRRYTKEMFLEKIKKIREIRPNICLTTDIIVGFAGETNEDFIETKNFLETCEFAKLHVFPFSRRKNAAAYNFNDQVDESIKKQRVRELIELSNQLENKYLSKFINSKIEFLIEQYDDETSSYKGHSSNYLTCYLKEKDIKVNSIKQVIVNFDNVKIE